MIQSNVLSSSTVAMTPPLNCLEHLEGHWEEEGWDTNQEPSTGNNSFKQAPGRWNNLISPLRCAIFKRCAIIKRCVST